MVLNRKTLDCESARRLMFDYIDGTLAPESVKRLEAHLGECGDCTRELEAQREMLAIVGECAYDAPASLYGGVMDKIKDMPQDAKILAPKLRMKPWMGTLAAACAAVMILVVGRGYLPTGSSNEVLNDEAALDIARINAGSFDAPSDADANGYYSLNDAVGGTVTNEYAEIAKEAYVETTTYSYAGLAPSSTAAPDKLQMDTAAPSYSATPMSVLDIMLGEFQSEDNALLVCYKADAADIIPTTDVNIGKAHDVAYEHYIIDTDAMVKFTGYIELFELDGVDYRTAVPASAEFEKCEIILITGGEN